MGGVNKVILVGNLGKDPEVRYLENGAVVANITLATTENYKDKSGNRVSNTEWHDLEMWDGLAKIAEQYLKKGKQIYVEGRIKSDTWEDDQGNTRKRTRIRVSNMTMLGQAGQGSNEGFSRPEPQTRSQTPVNTPEENPSSQESGEIDDLPF